MYCTWGIQNIPHDYTFRRQIGILTTAFELSGGVITATLVTRTLITSFLCVVRTPLISVVFEHCVFSRLQVCVYHTPTLQVNTLYFSLSLIYWPLIIHAVFKACIQSGQKWMGTCPFFHITPATVTHALRTVNVLLIKKFATLRVKSEKCSRVTNQLVYHNTFGLPHSTVEPLIQLL